MDTFKKFTTKGRRTRRTTKVIFFVVLCVLLPFVVNLTFCQDPNYTPKPRGYFRIDFPHKAYKTYNGTCPFSFEYPEYSSVEIDMERDSKPCWLNIEFPSFNATIHLSYNEVKNNLSKYTEDSRTLTNKHIVKATGIDESAITTPNHVYATKFNIEGNTASAVQFYATDSVHHFLRGALYFNVAPQVDSLAPVIRFVEADIDHLIETLKWK
jgi:gliding motility-associated lipoprotein GldD